MMDKEKTRSDPVVDYATMVGMQIIEVMRNLHLATDSRIGGAHPVNLTSEDIRAIAISGIIEANRKVS